MNFVTEKNVPIDNNYERKSNMPLSIVTNVMAMRCRTYLDSSTSTLNTAMNRMASGYRINTAKDDAAGYTIAAQMGTKLSSYDIALNNTQIGADLLSTLEENFNLINGHLERIRELTMQASNSTYSDSSKEAINAEVVARLNEISRVANSAEYNGFNLMDGTITTNLAIQAGIYGNDFSRIDMDQFLFDNATASALFNNNDLANISKKCSGLEAATKAYDMLSIIDSAITNVSTRVTQIGALQNRLDSALSAIDVASQNLTSSVSTIKDADIATESTRYIQAQILQQASSTLLVTANSSPSIALDLL